MIKKHVKRFLVIVTVVLIVIGTFNAVIDPYFHYHKPLSFLGYPIEYQRYQNDGIVKHFDYDAIITGSSMSENFYKSDLDKLFNTNSVKVVSSGGSYKEFSDLLQNAFKYNKNIKMVVQGLDYNRLLDEKDTIKYEKDWYPNYLYDENLFNDVNYLLNNSTTLSSMSVIINTLMGNKTTSFDEYSNWMVNYNIGKEYINYSRIEKSDKIIHLTSEDTEKIKDNFTHNILNLVEQHPNTQFYYFFSPYSILYFYDLKQNGNLELQFEAEKIAIELLLQYDNVHLYSFFDEYDIICDLNNYRDIGHYGEHINRYILECMKNKKHEIRKDNYLTYLENIKHFYNNYDYETLFE